MDPRTLNLILAALALASTGAIYGWKFLRKGNYLLGVEWLILALSSSNAAVYFATGFPPSLHIAHFFDAFSRAFGLPIVAVAGLMILTHRYRPSKRADVLYFVVSFAATYMMLNIPALGPALPYIYLIAWVVFSLYLAYFVMRLWNAGEMLQALALTVALTMSLVIACIYDFYKIPGEETNVFLNFFTIALFTWSYLTVQVYYAYCTLERAEGAAARLLR